MILNKSIESLYTSMAYDDAFRTLETECDDILVPYVNYVFNEHFDKSARITRLRNEHFIKNENQSSERRITDSSFEIHQDNITKKYHLECESKPYDKSLLIRIFEYDAHIALDAASYDTSSIRVIFPNTGLLLLRGSDKAPDSAQIIIEVPKDTLSYEVPIIKISDFSIDTIFEKSLFLLIPFYIFNYENDLKTINADKSRIESLKKLYTDIINKLDEYQKNGILSSQTCRVIIRLTHSVLFKITMKHKVVQQEVGDIMGGKVIEFPEITAYHDGVTEGKIEAILNSIKGIMSNLGKTAEEAMDILNVPKEDYPKYKSML